MAELLVVFVGVWLSLLAEDWRQNRVDSRTEQAAITRMAQDLQSDVTDLLINIDRAEVGVVYGRWLLARGASSDAPMDSLGQALSAVQFCSIFIENTGEYQALRDSGQLGIISDAALRQRVVTLYESRLFIRDLHRTDCTNNEFVFERMAPHVMVAEPPEIVDLGEVASDGFPDGSRPRITSVPDRASLFNDLAFLSRLTELVGFRNFLLGQILEQLGDTEGLKEALQSHLD